MKTFEFSKKGYEEMKNYREYLGGLIKFEDVRASKRRFKVSFLLILLIVSMLIGFAPGSTIAYSSKDMWMFREAMKLINTASSL